MSKTPTVTISTTPMTMWCTCVPPSLSMSWNHQLTWARMSRVLMRTKRKVASSPTRNPAMAARASPIQSDPDGVRGHQQHRSPPACIVRLPPAAGQTARSRELARSLWEEYRQLPYPVCIRRLP